MLVISRAVTEMILSIVSWVLGFLSFVLLADWGGILPRKFSDVL